MQTAKRKFISGFTIAELLIALAVMALLLAAVATAFKAAAANFKGNEGLYKTVTAARGAIFLMTSQIRTGLVDANDMSTGSCKLLCADNSEVSYQYNSGEKKLYLHNETTGANHVLCENVVNMTFEKDNTPTGRIKSVQISMTVENNNVRQTISAAAVVRRILN